MNSGGPLDTRSVQGEVSELGTLGIVEAGLLTYLHMHMKYTMHTNGYRDMYSYTQIHKCTHLSFEE